MSRIVDGVEIPEDFEGIDDDIALGMMKDHGLISDQQEKVEVTTTEEPTGKDPVETSASEEEVATPTGEAAPVKEQETGDETTEPTDGANKTVPYAAMKAERDKRKKEQRQNEALQAELAQLRAERANPMQIQQPVAQQQNTQQTEQSLKDQQQAYEDYIDQASIDMFKARNGGREPDDLDSKDTRAVARYAVQIESKIIKQQEEEQLIAKKNASETQQTNQTYQQFVVEQKAKDEFDDIWKSFNENFNSLPDDEKIVIDTSFKRCEQGKGSRQDVLLIKKIWNEVASKHAQSLATETEQATKVVAPVVTPPKPSKTDEEKLEQIEKHPRVNLVSGTNASKSGRNMDEIARLINSMPWLEFVKTYPDDAEYVLNS